MKNYKYIFIIEDLKEKLRVLQRDVLRRLQLINIIDERVESNNNN